MRNTMMTSLPVVMLISHCVLVARISHQQAPVWDEVAHLPAGISHLQLGRFDLFRANPPLVRLVAALPVVAAGAEVDWHQYSGRPGVRSEFDVGRDFMRANGAQSFHYFVLARWACIVFTVLGGYVCWRWARGLYGHASGLLAAALWCVSPNILGNAAWLTPDLGATSAGLLASYFFWRWLAESDAKWTLCAAIALGAALLAKFTWLILVVLWPGLWIAFRLARVPQSREYGLLKESALMGSILLMALLVVNIGYGFVGTFTPAGDFEFISESLAGTHASWRQPESDNLFAHSWLGRVPVPLPKDFILGIDVVKEALESGRQSYLRGEFRNDGWWYYYLYALAVKETVGTWLLAGTAGWLSLTRKGYAATPRDTLVLLAPAVVLLAAASSNQGIIQFRYILPVLPFLFIWISQVARSVEFRHYGVASVAGLALAWSVVSSLWVYPHSGSYFNELAGGPKNGHAHLLSSAIDWGQDLLYLKRWLDKHPEATPLGLAYYGGFDPAVAAIDYHLPAKGMPDLPESPRGNRDEFGPHPGWYAVSVHILRGAYATVSNGGGGRESLPFGCYQYFLRFEPTAMAGYSIYVYRITLDDANRVREELGLPPLPDDWSGGAQ